MRIRYKTHVCCRVRLTMAQSVLFCDICYCTQEMRDQCLLCGRVAFFPENSIFFLLRVRLFCMALVEQLGDDGRWYVQLAAIWHWYLPLYIYIIFFNFMLCLFIHLFLFNLVLIN